MKENESKEDHENRQLVYELTGIRDESMHIKPYADMIDKLTYVQKADFAKRALELERDCATYKKMFEEVSRERNAWISEYNSLASEKNNAQNRANHWYAQWENVLGRTNALEEWLTEYRDDLKKDPNYRINRYYMIEAINELLNGTD